MKLLFVMHMPPEHAVYWQDGLWAALQQFETTFLNVWGYATWEEEFNRIKDNHDAVLGWGGTTSPHFPKLLFEASSGKVFWSIGGGDYTDEQYDQFPIVFVENEFQTHLKANFRHAFGTNTDLFIQMPFQAKLIDALYPAGFAQWKHQDVFAEICKKEGLKGLAVGYMQPDNPEETEALVRACLVRGVAVMNWIPANSLTYLYNMSKQVIITADPSGGCERAILEAKACGVPVRIVSDSQKLHDLNKLTSEEVREKWNHRTYAESIKKGINEVLSNR